MQRIQQALELARQEAQSKVRQEPWLDGASERPEPPESTPPTEPARAVTLDAHPTARRMLNLPAAIARRAPVRPLRADVCERNRLKLGTEADATAQAYRMLRTRVLQWLDTQQRNTLAMVSSGEGDGKTLSAVNLALSIANDTNHTVLLVDFDLRSPSVHRYLELDVAQGLERFFSGDAAIEDLLVSVAHPRLAVLPCLTPIAGSSNLLAGNTVRDLVAELKSRYTDRVILFDLPPALQGDDTIAFLPLVDAALLVIGEGSTRKEDLARVAELLAATPVIGSVLNRAARSATPHYG